MSNSPLNFLWLSSTPREFDSLKEKQQIESSGRDYWLSTLISALMVDEEEVLTLVDDDSLHSLLELVSGSQAFDGSAQHSLLLRQSTLQPQDLVFQQLVLLENTIRHPPFFKNVLSADA